LVQADLVDCIVSLPDKLFLNTGIGVSLWFVSKNRHGNGHRQRTGELLFIDARGLGTMETRTLRTLSDDEIARVANTYHAWRSKTPSMPYEDVPGFCKSASMAEIEEHGFILSPSRYVGLVEPEEDDEPASVRVKRLEAELLAEFDEGLRLEKIVRERLGKIVE
jgi:type I restriction enzyme M protein